MWTFIQTGTLVGPDDQRYPAYSGKGDYKNRPEAQTLENLGPIPCGSYQIGDPFDSPEHGKYVLRLTPDPANEMFGRAGFLIHGDKISAPGTASEGCIIAARPAREAVHNSQDRTLQVIAGEPESTVAMDPGMEAE